VNAPLNAAAVRSAARDIRMARYLAHSVTDEALVERVVTVYQEAARTPRKPRAPRPPRRPAKA